MIDLNKKNILILPPMAGYTEAACRTLARAYGADLTFTEMVSAKGLYYKNENTASLLYTAPDESGVGVQLFGSDADIIAEVVTYPVLSKFGVIDINMGCPVNKIVKNGEGSALLKSPALIYGIVRKAKAAANGRPVSVKLRLGFEKDSFLALDAALAAESAGAAMVTVHARRREDFYGGEADLDAAARVREGVRIPFIINGDIFDKKSYGRAMSVTKADGAAIGRGALGRFYVFREVAGQPYEYDREAVLKEHIAMLKAFYNGREAVNFIKKHLACYFKGVPGAKRKTAAALGEKTLEGLVKTIF